MGTKTVLACRIFKDLIDEVVDDKKENINFIWLEAGLHSHINILEEKLLENIKNNKNVSLLYCEACLPDMPVFAKKNNVKILKTKNCLSAMVGEKEVRKLETENKAMVITPAWIRVMWNKDYSSDLVQVWDEIDFKINLGRYDNIIVLDPQIEPFTDEEILECFDLVQVPIEVLPCQLDYFKSLLKDFLQN